MTLHLALHNGRIMQRPVTAHLAAERLAAFLDGRLTGDERAQAVAHFATCADCRHELTELRQTLDSAPYGHRRRWFAGVAALAATLVLAIVLPRVRNTDDGLPAPGSEVRGVRGDEGGDVIAIAGPADGAIVRLPLTLSWQSAGRDASYLVVVQDTVGAEVLRASLGDTSLTMSDSVRLVPGTRYYWKVDAKLVDGGSAKTERQSFRVR